MTGFTLDAAAVPAGGSSASATRLALRRFGRNPVALVSTIILAVLALLALLAPVVEIAVGVTANDVDLFNRLTGPSLTHFLGTDEIGRDLFVRLLYGGRISLLVGLTAAGAAAVIGTILGILAGYYGGRLDGFLMRFTDGVIVKAGPARRLGAGGGYQPLSHRRVDRSGRLDHGCPPGARRDPGHPAARIRPRRRRSGCGQ
jgi:ABC-type Fe3+ transport system permease subunit